MAAGSGGGKYSCSDLAVELTPPGPPWNWHGWEGKGLRLRAPSGVSAAMCSHRCSRLYLARRFLRAAGTVFSLGHLMRTAVVEGQKL